MTINTVLQFLKKVPKKVWVSLISLLVGLALGSVFLSNHSEKTRLLEEMYQSKLESMELELKQNEEKYKSSLIDLQQSKTQVIEEFSNTVQKLRVENTELRMSSRKQTYKIVKPDGTIIEKEYEEHNQESITSVITEVREEFNSKVAQIEQQWREIHEERVREINEQHRRELNAVQTELVTRIEEDKEVRTSAKRFRAEVGVTSDVNYYLHSSYSLFGPVVIGGGFTANTDGFKEARIGIGIEF